jgi:hypothetical protein
MAISVFPIAVATSSSLNASAITAASANVLYEGRATFDPGVYTVTCASGVITNFQFFNGTSTTPVLSGVTVSGTVSINLASTADRIRLYTNTGTNTVVSITKTANSLTNQFSGTLDTITSSGTYTGTSTSGLGYAIIIGGGGGGGGAVANTNQSPGATGGGSGASPGKLVALTGSMEVTLGAGGAGGTNESRTGISGGSSTFAGMTAGGGSGGGWSNGGGVIGGGGGTATGGDINLNGNGGSGQIGGGVGGAGAGPSSPYPFAITSIPSTYGRGGVGGTSSGSPTPTGGAGTPGVLYVLRF